MTIKTAGDLRSFLAVTLEGIRDGKVDAEQASSIAKISAQINNSIAVEVKAAIEMQRLSKGSPQAGSMIIANPYTAEISKPTESENFSAWCSSCKDQVPDSEIAECMADDCPFKAAS